MTNVFMRSPGDQVKFQNAVEAIRKTRSLFDCEPWPRDSVLSGSSPVGTVPQLNWLHVEALLDQSSDLLDRAVSTRQHLRNLERSHFALLQEVNEFAALDAILIKEEEDGVLAQPLMATNRHYHREWHREQDLRQLGEKMKEDLVDDIYSTTDSTYKRMLAAVQGHAELAGLPAYYYAGQTGRKYSRQKVNGHTRLIREHAKNFAGRQFSYSNTEKLMLLGIRSKEVETQREGAKRERDRLDEERKLERKKLDWRHQRILVARRYHQDKMAAIEKIGGVLHYPEQIKGVQDRLTIDFESAIFRLISASEGLKKLYGYPIPMPQKADFETADSFFDAVYAWCRIATQWVISHANSDQSLVHVVSLRQQLGEEKWSAGLRDREWKMKMRHDEELPGAYFVRLRGVGMCTRVDNRANVSTTFRAHLDPPKTGTIPTSDGTSQHIDQAHLKRVTLGRVCSRDFPVDPDVSGMSELFNATPFGDEWTIRCEKVGYSPEVKLQDIEIAFHLIYKS